MKKIILPLIVLGSIWAAIPWTSIWLEKIDTYLDDYKLGLDLHGGIELDYLVDFSNTQNLTPERKTQILEDMKTILDGRVRRVGTTEPTLNTAYYGDETHIIVQIPTPSENDRLSPVERQKKDEQFIAEAKEVIGQVVKIQFKEPRPENEFQEILKKRGSIMASIEREFNKHDPFDSFAGKMADTYENVFSLKKWEIGAITWGAVTLKNLKTALGKEIKITGTSFNGKVTDITLGGRKGDGFIQLQSLDNSVINEDTILDAKLLFVDKEPLRFKAALGKNGEVLDEKHLINTIPSPDPTTGQYIVNLVFDETGKKMFGDITEKNAGGVIAIFLGNRLLTAPHVSARIDGNAIITSGNEPDSKKWATSLSKQINEGIVPVGIYEHSEHTIGPNLGQTSLKQLIISGIIGLIVICVFLFWRYRMAGVIAGLSLVIYIIILLALVRVMGVTLTLSGVAGIVLSLGVAIDSNILLLERVRDFLDHGKDVPTALKLGFREAWSAVWDSNLTGLLVGLVLWWMGVSLVKGFGQMTVLGIIVSLCVVKYICNPLTIWMRNKIG